MATQSAYPAGALYSVRTDKMNIGNYKYGNIERILEENLFHSDNPLFTVELQENMAPEFRSYEETMFFYGVEGKEDIRHIISRRKFPIVRDGFMELEDLETSRPVLRFNKIFRRYSLTKLSKSGTIGENLTDITTLKLLDFEKLSFHGGCIRIGERGIVITGLPDVGKTYSTMELLRRNSESQFLAEDILIADAEGLVYAVPFTQTVEKRRNLSVLERMTSSIYNSFIRHNYIKNDVLEVMPELKQRVIEKTPVEAIFFLKKGPKGIVKITNKGAVIEEFVRLNNLEFTFSRNILLLSALYFGRQACIGEYLNKERELIAKLANSLDVYEVYAEKPQMYAEIIQKFI